MQNSYPPHSALPASFSLWMLPVWVLLLSSPLLADSPLDHYPELFDTLLAGDYAAAAVLCDTLAEAYAEHPGNPYARAALLYTHMLDFEDSVGRAEFWALTDEVIRRCDEWLKRTDSLSAEIEFLKGSSWAMRGLLLHHEGKLMQGVRQLMKAKGAFDTAIEADPTFYDAYLGRGAYRYAVARYTSAIGWLPWVPSLESAWQDLWLAAQRSRFSRYSTLSAVVWFALENRDLQLADSICDAGQARFPTSRSFLFPRLALHVKLLEWGEAEQVALTILNQYLSHPDNNGYEPIGLYWRLMHCADAMHRPEEAKAYAIAGLETYRTPDVAQRRKDKLAELEARLARK